MERPRPSSISHASGPFQTIATRGGTWIATVRSGGESHHYFNFGEGTAMFRKLIYCFAALATALALSACNTMTGVGKDVEKGGQKIQEESKEVQRKL
jgi:entericidin B